jgi:hypothetical protein
MAALGTIRTAALIALAVAGSLPAQNGSSIVLARGSGQRVDEYVLKAAILYNVAKFVEWPPEAFKTADDPIRICVLGQGRLTSALDESVPGKRAVGRAIAIAAIEQAGDAGNCQIVFIGASEQKRLRSILAALPAQTILTIGETGGFAEQGGMVNLKLEDAKVRLEINVEAAGRARLRISSKLLSLARIVR